ncbi:MAG: 2-C-methyl-D-erythritol 2,4-cyclodiphosphate synthase [Chloroflexi bacterium]|nr:2-C-methyl-D-erythritol 2,4-cyclodiphosphate synthase [Chloroflexota bacterium]
MRVGIGLDAHRLAADRRLVLGGVEIPSALGLLGHSDADALLHAIVDALLGAAGLGDIGQHFPPSDERYRNISSRVLLARTKEMVAAAGWQLVNVDATVVAQRPHLAPHIPEMRRRIAETLGVDVARVSVKATTSDSLGAIGRGEGIAAQAVALLEQRPAPPGPLAAGGI